MKTIKNGVAAIACLLLVLFCQLANAQVNAAFTANITANCSPLVVQFQDQSTGPVTGRFWRFGNGNTSTQANPGAIYINPGLYTVTLIVTDGSTFDTLTQTNYIEVFQEPTPQFTATPTSGCQPLPVSFNNTSTAGSAPIAATIWNFGDGNGSSDANPTNVYDSAGTYDVTLLVIDQNGCEGEITQTNYINVLSQPTADFSSNDNSACAPPVTVNFQNNSSPASGMSYQWNFGNGNTSTQANPSESYNSPGNYDVTLIVTGSNGCKDTLMENDFVNIQSMTTDFTSDKTKGCQSGLVQFTDLTVPTPDSWVWDFGDGTTDTTQNPIHQYTNPGSYTVTLFSSVAGSCSNSVTKTGYITIYPNSAPNFTQSPPTSCDLPFNVSFIDQSVNAVSWFWDFGDGNTSSQQNPTHTYMIAGEFTVTLTTMSIDSCFNSLTKTRLVRIVEPNAYFGGDTVKGCAPLTVDFIDSSTTGQPITNWFWDFGDGTTSTLQHPSHSFTNVGEYDITLVIENLAGCRDTITRVSYVEAGNKPTANLVANPTQSCLSSPLSFTNLTTPSSDQWYWTFGDGSWSNDENPTYTYGDTGYFNITLIAWDNGCPDTVQFQNYIHIDAPDARYSVIQNCNTPYTIDLQDMSLAPDNWFWDFGDGTTSTSQNPTHTYASTGTYTVSLTVENFTSGCTDVEQATVEIIDLQAAFTQDTTVGCAPLLVNFTDQSTSAISWQWYINGVPVSTDPAFSYNFRTPVNYGTHTVSLVVTDANGCTDSLAKEDVIEVYGIAANIDANPTTGCSPLLVQFFDSSITYGGPSATWLWEFGDGTTDTTQNPTHLYTQTGSFDIRLTVTNTTGCNSRRTFPKFITPTYPSPNFTADTLSCTSKSVSFTNLTPGNGLTYLWSFGDGTTDTATHPDHFYINEGIYTISLTATDQNGCDSTITKVNYVTVSDPVADIVADTTFSPCPPLLVNFSDLSSPDAVAWFWDFGDGKTSTKQNPSHVYLAPGDYDVTLIITNSVGCTDTITKDDLVLILGPNGTFTFMPGQGCLGTEVTFNAVTTNTVSRTWDFGDGNVQFGGDTISHIYNSAGIFWPVVILDDGLGCTYAVSAEDSVVIGDLDPDFDASATYICKAGTVDFSDSTIATPPATTWFWDFGDGSTDTVQNPSHYYSQPGTYDVTLIVGNSACQDTLLKPNFILVDDGPTSDFSTSVPFSCDSNEIIFFDASMSDTTLTEWFWDFGDGATDTLPSTSHAYNAPGTYTVTLISGSITGCSDTVSKIMQILLAPTGSAGRDTTMCAGDSIQLNGTGGFYYSWSPSQHLSYNQIPNPIATPDTTTQFVLTVTDSLGCIDTDTINVIVNPLPVMTISPNRDICIGDSAHLLAGGGASYNWLPVDSLSCSNCPNPVATPTTSVNYTVEITTALGCTNDTSLAINVYEYPQGIITGDTTICEGESIQIETSAGYEFVWAPAAGLTCNTCPNPLATPDTTTTYTVIINNKQGCETIDSITITVNPLPQIQVKATNEICLGDSVTLFALGGDFYNWSPSTGLSCDNCSSPGASPDTTTNYLLTVTTAAGCVDSTSILVEVNPLPVVNTIDDITICNGDFVELTTSMSNTAAFDWTPAAGLNQTDIASPTATPSVTTDYVITAYSADNCIARDTVTIEVIDKVLTEITDDTEICLGESLQLNVNVLQEGHMGTNVVWTPVNDIDQPTSFNPIVTPPNTIEYTMTAFSGSCEPDTQTVLVTVNPLPDVILSETEYLHRGTEIELTVESSHNIINYAWNPTDGMSCSSCQTTSVFVTDQTEYSITLTDDNGCQNTNTVNINVVGDCGDDVFVPNTFTPNGDDRNDQLFVRGLATNELRTFRVFDRWGNLVFETDDINEGWNGTFNGYGLTTGVFVYYIETVCTNGNIAQVKGNVTLLR